MRVSGTFVPGALLFLLGAEVQTNGDFHIMAGNSKGGQLAAETNKKRHGADFYARIGAMGGKKGRTGGFFANRDLARAAGQKGGRISRRTKKSDVASVQSDLDLAA